MADLYSKEKRSEIMSHVRSKWTKPEIFFHNYLKGRKIKHRMHPKIIGNPDILLTTKKTVVFIDGCFWHGCKKCYKAPKSSVKFWSEKIKSNVERDVRNEKLLKSKKFKVLRIKGHEFRNMEKVLLKIDKVVKM